MLCKPEKWLCSDGKTWRAGDRKNDIWWNVKNEALADRIVEAFSGLTVSELIAQFRGEENPPEPSDMA